MAYYKEIKWVRGFLFNSEKTGTGVKNLWMYKANFPNHVLLKKWSMCLGHILCIKIKFKKVAVLLLLLLFLLFRSYSSFCPLFNVNVFFFFFLLLLLLRLYLPRHNLLINFVFDLYLLILLNYYITNFLGLITC